MEQDVTNGQCDIRICLIYIYHVPKIIMMVNHHIPRIVIVSLKVFKYDP